LKRLCRWARQAPAPPPAGAPTGFAGRVVARWEHAVSLFSIWQRAITVSGWASAVLILCGLAFILTESRDSGGAYDFTTAYEVAATNIAP
jgi:hypothetical protein